MSNFDFQKFLLAKANESIANNLDRTYRLNDQADKIIVWLVGFSVTALTLIIANFDSKIEFVQHIADVVVIFSVTIITLGILQRVFSQIAQRIDLSMIVSFDYFVTGYKLEGNSWFNRSLSEDDNSIEEVKKFLEEDFGFKSKESDQEFGIERLIDIYYDLQERRLDFESKLFEETMSENLGRHALKTSSTDSRKSHAILFNLANYFYQLTCVVFLGFVITITVMYFSFKTISENPSPSPNNDSIEASQNLDKKRQDSISKNIKLDTIKSGGEGKTTNQDSVKQPTKVDTIKLTKKFDTITK